MEAKRSFIVLVLGWVRASGDMFGHNRHMSGCKPGLLVVVIFIYLLELVSVCLASSVGCLVFCSKAF